MFDHFLVVFMAFFAMMNPISSLPVYLSVTSGDEKSVRLAVARRSLILAFIIISVFTLAGNFIFMAFGISLPALRIAGGLIIFIIGLQMLHGESSRVQRPSSAETHDALEQQMSVAVSPLGMPILAGPGTIATAMSFSSQKNDFLGIGITILAFGLLCLITFGIFYSGSALLRMLGTNVLNVLTRLMGLILAVIGVQMTIVGLKGAFPVLAG